MKTTLLNTCRLLFIAIIFVPYKLMACEYLVACCWSCEESTRGAHNVRTTRIIQAGEPKGQETNDSLGAIFAAPPPVNTLLGRNIGHEKGDFTPSSTATGASSPYTPCRSGAAAMATPSALARSDPAKRLSSVDYSIDPSALSDTIIDVLVVDDNSTNSRPIARNCDKRGRTACTVDSGEKAVLFFARNNKASIVIMDYLMGGITGLEATRQIKTAHPGLTTKFFLYSTEDPSILETALASGLFAGKLPKPYEIANLETILAS